LSPSALDEPGRPVGRDPHVGQVFRVPYRGAHDAGDSAPSYLVLTRGAHSASADLQKGMFFFEQFPEPRQAFARVPAFIFHSNPYRSTPWIDVVEPDAGYCMFHGDNRTPGAPPLSSRGNSRFAKIASFYADPSLRKFAPPVLVFEQVEFRGTRRGYRKFSGFGVPTRFALATQAEKRGGYFTNLVIELALFRLDRENETFPWHWIDERRRRSVDADQALRAAPSAWKEWVRDGDLAVDGCRRIVARQAVVPVSNQSAIEPGERQVLAEVREYYDRNRHAFEGLASLVAERVLGAQCRRGWVTKRSGDGGIDFVLRLDVGDPADRLSRASAVVLGQAKCVGPKQQVGGHALARVVARLQRGWIGVFVTTGTFSQKAQLELSQDKYPVVLIGGRRLAKVLVEITTQERIRLRDLLDRESKWYAENSRNVHPARILDDAFSFSTSSAASLVAASVGA
jgi:hypothetical protein